MSKPSLISSQHRGRYVTVSAGRSGWGPSPGSSRHAAYHEKDHLLNVSRTQSRYHRSSDQGELVLGMLEAKFRMVFIARGKFRRHGSVLSQLN